MWTGRGVSAQVSGVSVLAGNQKLLEEQQISVPKAAQADIQAALQKGCTVIHIVADGKFAGYLVISDTVRIGSAGMIAQLKKLERAASVADRRPRERSYSHCFTAANYRGVCKLLARR